MADETVAAAIQKVEEKPPIWKRIPDNPNTKYVIFWMTGATLAMGILGGMYRLSKL